MADTNPSTLSLVDVLQPAYVENPYPLYKRLRDFDPIYWDAGAGSWVLTRHQEVTSFLRDPRAIANRVNPSPAWIPEAYREALTPPMRAMAEQMLFLDPPDHTRLRGLVSKAFTPRQVEALRPQVRQIVHALLDDLLPQGQMELVHDFAYPLPIAVISRMLGVPAEDSPLLIKWSGDFGFLLDGSNFTLDAALQALQSMNEFMDYFRAQIRARRQRPQDDILQLMINAEEQGDHLSEHELLGNCILLLAAGHITTTHLIGNGLLALLRAPDQLHLLRTHPALIPTAVPELLRFDSPVQYTERKVKEDLQLGDKQIQAGQLVSLCLGAANHDPAFFADPDTLHVDRTENKHLAFGQGIHFCLGAPLARLEAEEAFSALIARLDHIELATDHVEREPSLVFRSVKALPITYTS